MALLGAGQSQRRVADAFNTTRSTVQAIANRWKTNQSLKVRPRKGRPKKLSSYEKRYILRMIRKDRAITWNALVGTVDTRVCVRTIQRLIHTHYARKWKAMGRPKLDRYAASTRLRWARIWIEKIDDLVEVCDFEVSGDVN